jgi:hypothetical protein
MQANRTSGVGATIMLPAGVYKLTIPAAGTDDETTGDLNLTSPANGNPVITITGAGPGNTIIDANQLDRAFHVHAGRIATISGVTIRNGYIVGDNAQGGGINNKGVLTVSNTLITLNHTAASGEKTASYGGGISNIGSLTVVDTTISHNIADDDGGGIANYGSLTVITSTISHNITAERGGGIYSAGDLNVRDSTIGPTNSADQGGGVYTGVGLTMRNSTINGNTAVEGGGIFNFGTVTAMNTTISQNIASKNGEGIYNIAGAAGVYNATIVFNGV